MKRLIGLVICMSEQVQIEKQEEIQSSVKTEHRVKQDARQVQHCMRCGSEVESVDDVKLDVLNPSFTYHGLVDTIANVTEYRLYTEVDGLDWKEAGLVQDKTLTKTSNKTYSKEVVDEQVRASLALNSWHGCFSSHTNAPSLHADTIDMTCEACCEDELDTTHEEETDVQVRVNPLVIMGIASLGGLMIAVPATAIVLVFIIGYWSFLWFIMGFIVTNSRF